MDLKGTRVLVTGASSGIGAGLAEEFAVRGAEVGICARRADRLEEVLHRCQAHSPRSRMWVKDLGSPGAPEALAETVLNEFGPVDVLVNNAGMPKRRHVTKLDGDTVEEVMRLNFFAPVRLTLALLPALMRNGAGRVINIASVAATLSSPNESAYDASKSALAVFSEAMAIDLWDRGVKVLVVYPGLVETDLLNQVDNDPIVDSPTVPVPVADVVTAVFDAMAAETTQIYVPAFFEDLAAGKARNVPGFLAGAAEFVSSKQVPPVSPATTRA